MKALKYLMKATVAVALVFGAAKAQAPDTTQWKLGGDAGLTFNQVGLFNWAAGGASTLTLISAVNLHADRITDESDWENDLNLAFGFVKTNYIYDPQAPFTKADDRIEFTSKYGREAWSEKLRYTGLLGFRTQFAPGYANAGDSVYISKFFAPAYINAALGMEYVPNKHWSLFLSPLSTKITLVTDTFLANRGDYGVNRFDDDGDRLPGTGDWYRVEMGATFRGKFSHPLRDDKGKFETMVELFSNYIDRPQNVDVRWTTLLLVPVTSWLNVNFNSELIYDKDINIPLVDGQGQPLLDPITGEQRREPRVQFKEVFGIGVLVKFGQN